MFYINMSRAIASARQRRAGISAEIPPPPTQQQQSQQQGLTLPQVISVVDARLIKLEKFMNESQQQSLPQQQQQQPQSQQLPTEQLYVSPSFINEVQTRFDLLAQEIMTLKDVVLKLQTYTMDVNKMLLDERVPIENNGFFMENVLDTKTTSATPSLTIEEIPISFQQTDELVVG
jgi:hypothetical protein